jgi:hypothetical protein
MPTRRNPQTVSQLLSSGRPVELADLQDALDDASPATVHRYLRRVPYRRSYNHNGRYYVLHDPSQYDRHGLFSIGDVHFSLDGSLVRTVRRMVREAVAGATQRELQDRLRVRVHNPLLTLHRRGEIGRESIPGVYLYVHIAPDVRREQLLRRQEQIEAAAAEREARTVSDATIIKVLLVLIHYPGSRIADVVRRLRGHDPPLPRVQVQAVFDRYDLGQKGGPATC